MKQAYRRADRVGQLLQQELSAALLREVKDPRVQHVTITAVEVADDLRSARVYFSTALADQRIDEVQQGLERAAGFLQHHIAKALDLRYTPRLKFSYDESFDRGAHMDQVLADLPKSKSEEE